MIPNDGAAQSVLFVDVVIDGVYGDVREPLLTIFRSLLLSQ